MLYFMQANLIAQAVVAVAILGFAAAEAMSRHR